jgi:hypothetical protein
MYNFSAFGRLFPISFITVFGTAHDEWVCHQGTLWMEEMPPIWRAVVNILNSSQGQPTRGGPQAWGLNEVLKTPHHENWQSYET